MAETITREVEHLIRRAMNMSCEDQHTLASTIAANVGYALTPDNYAGQTRQTHAPAGCVCPPTSEQTCKSIFCPRGGAMPLQIT